MLSFGVSSLGTTVWTAVHNPVFYTSARTQLIAVGFWAWVQTLVQAQVVQFLNTVVYTPKFAVSNLLNNVYTPFTQDL